MSQVITTTPVSIDTFIINMTLSLCSIDIRPRVHKETENEDQAQDQIDKFP